MGHKQNLSKGLNSHQNSLTFVNCRKHSPILRRWISPTLALILVTWSTLTVQSPDSLWSWLFFSCSISSSLIYKIEVRGKQQSLTATTCSFMEQLWLSDSTPYTLRLPLFGLLLQINHKYLTTNKLHRVGSKKGNSHEENYKRSRKRQWPGTFCFPSYD